MAERRELAGYGLDREPATRRGGGSHAGASGIAVLGALFQHTILATLRSLLAGTPAAGHASQLARAVAAGGSRSGLLQASPAARAALSRAAHQAFVNGFNQIALVGFAVAAAGALAAYMLVRSRDLTPATGRQHTALTPAAAAGSTT